MTDTELLAKMVKLRAKLDRYEHWWREARERMAPHRDKEGIASHSINTHSEVGVLLEENAALRKRAVEFDALATLMANDIGHARLGKDGKPLFDLMCSDTFHWACADGEAMTIDQAPEVMRLYAMHGYRGVAEWIQQKRGGPEAWPFIKPVQEDFARDVRLRDAAQAIIDEAKSPGFAAYEISGPAIEAMRAAMEKS